MPELVSPAPTEAQRFQILALDGGGIKGMFAAAVLTHLEEHHGIRMMNHFDLVTGTSTGGIIALGLAYGLSPRQILDFYVQHGKRIFASPGGDLLAKLRWVFRSKYDPSNLKQSLLECFGEAQLGRCKHRVLIPSYNLGEHRVHVFKTAHNPRLKYDYLQPIWKIALATSAAPTYFPVFSGVHDIRLIDGGVWANNPSAVAVAEAVSMLGQSLGSIRVLSIGTTMDLCRRPTWLDKGGLASWPKAAAEVFLEAQTESAIGLTEHLVGKGNLLRLSPKVSPSELALDRLEVRRLLGKAATEARELSPSFQSMFTDHMAPKPVFAYSLDEPRENEEAKDAVARRPSP